MAYSLSIRRKYYEAEKRAHKTPEYRKANAARKRARYAMEKKHGKAALRGKEVDHKNHNPNDNRASNLSIISKTANRKKQPKRK